MSLALTIVAFIRLRQRGLRVGLLAASGVATLVLIVYYATGRLNNLAFLAPVLVEWGSSILPPAAGKTPETQPGKGSKTGKSPRHEFYADSLTPSLGRCTYEESSRRHG